jgi:hypothetical protein
MAGSVPAADRQRLEAAQSVARAESALVTSRVAQQRSMALPGLYATEAAAAGDGTTLDWSTAITAFEAARQHALRPR